MKKTIAIVISFMGVLALCASVFAGTPFRLPVTMTAGVGTLTYSNGIANPAFSAFQVNAVILGSAASTATVSAVSGSITNLLGSKVVTATDKGYLVTNGTWGFIGDKVRLTSTDTNTHNVYVIGEEQ